MKEKEINAFRDCGITILCGSGKEFLKWLEERKIKSFYEIKETIFGYTGKRVISDGEISQFIWINTDVERTEAKVCGTIAHEATHAVDNIELYICNNPGQGTGERIPRELRARMVEEIVSEAVEMIHRKEEEIA